MQDNLFGNIEELREQIKKIDTYANMSLTGELPDGRIIEYTFAPSMKKLIELSKKQQNSAWYAWAKLRLFEGHFHDVHKGDVSGESFDTCEECNSHVLSDKRKEYDKYIDIITKSVEKALKETNGTE